MLRRSCVRALRWWVEAGALKRTSVLVTAGSLLTTLVLLVPRWFDVAPSPRGAVMQVALPEAPNLLMTWGGSAWLLYLRPLPDHSAIDLYLHHWEWPTTIRVAYPSGRVVHERSEFRAVRHERPPRVEVFDLDGDGHPDRLDPPYQPSGYLNHPFRVLSGADGRVLYDLTQEPSWHRSNEVVPLGDLDGDGYAELAVIYPRRDSSQPSDMDLSGTRSWLVVISGSRL